MLARVRTVLWITAGLVALGLAAAGAVLPLLPTTPFLLAAAFCFARSSRRLHDWLISHRLFGPMILAWRSERAIPRRAKVAAYGAMAATFGLSLALAVRPEVLIVQAILMGAAAVFVATRPEPRPTGEAD